MRATIRLKLQTDTPTTAALWETLGQFTDSFNTVCRYGWDANERNGVRLHQATYKRLRGLYPSLPSQLVVSARRKATEALQSVHARNKKGRKGSCPTSPRCPVRYDRRSYWVRLEDGCASLATTQGRVCVTFSLPDCYRRYLSWRTTSADLCWDPRKGRFYLHVVMETDAPAIPPNGHVLGCDLGVRRVAVTSKPQFLSSARLHTRARQFLHLRAALQRKGTKSARRHLQRMSHRWYRFVRNENHSLAKAILAPLVTGDTLALEDLTGIRERCQHRKAQRGLFHRWSFAQLQAFLAYKAEQKGVVVVTIDPRNSSRECSRCHHIAKSNRKSQSWFVCQSCGYRANADFNAAQVLRQRGIAVLARLLSVSPSCQTPFGSKESGGGLGASPCPLGRGN